MPIRDGTGPTGKGSSTGLGRGLCDDKQTIKKSDVKANRGFGSGLWKGRRDRRSEQRQGSRRGRGFGRGQGRGAERNKEE